MIPAKRSDFANCASFLIQPQRQNAAAAQSG